MSRATPILVLTVSGAAWGLTLPLARIAASTGHPPLGLVVWHTAIMALVLVVVLGAMRLPWPKGRRPYDLFFAVAVLGGLLPGYLTYWAAPHIPAGVRSVLISIVPMFVLPIALLLGFERPDLRRTIGVGVGAVAIAVIAVASVRGPAAIDLWALLVTLVVPLSYAIEGNYLYWRGSAGLHPFQVLLGASLLGLVLIGPLAIVAGQMPDFAEGLGPAEAAMLGAGLLSALAYSGYVWLVGHSGAVFASQVSYLVTGFGVLWSRVLLSETYALWTWLGFAMMLVGVALVQPRRAVAEKP